MKLKSFLSFLLICVCVVCAVFLLKQVYITSETEIVTTYIYEKEVRLLTNQMIIMNQPSDPIAESDDIGIIYETYNYALPVPESEEVDTAYFDKAVFIGDSRMLGLIKYTAIKPINYCSVGFSVAEYDRTPFVKLDEGNFTVKEALLENNDYDAVYISTGLNELGWSIGRFDEKYREMLIDIKSKAEGRPVYIQLIMPVTSEFEASKVMNPYKLKNSDVVLFNDRLKAIAEEYEVYYIDCLQMFVLENGTLDPEKSSDGAHLTMKAYEEQLGFYKTHVADVK